MNNQMAALKSNAGQLNSELDSASPFLIEFFTVQALGVKCMAYRGDDGKWRNAFDHFELPGFIHVLE